MATIEDFYRRVLPCLSSERLGAYVRRLPPTADRLDVLAHYLWNTALSQALYPAIQALEVALRNRLHAAAMARYGTDRWFAHPSGPALAQWQRDEVQRATDKLARLDRRRSGNPNPPPPAAGRIIAELACGFWVGFFNDDYDPAVHSLWRGTLLLATFPHLPPDEPHTQRNRRVYRTRRALSPRLNRVLRLRNRLSHHEPIWYWRDAASDRGESAHRD